MCDQTRDDNDQVGQNNNNNHDDDAEPAAAASLTSIATLVHNLQQLAHEADYNRHNRPVSVKNTFWDDGPRYASALRLLADVLQNFPYADDHPFLEYPTKIKRPLCFRDIVSSLLVEQDGILPKTSRLAGWNLWNGMELLRAMDLVFLNHVIIYSSSSYEKRSTTKRLRKTFWEGIHKITNVLADVEKRRQCTPTKRKETSGFVLAKSKIE